MKKLSLCILLAGFSFSALASDQVPAATYQIKELSGLGGLYTWPIDINENNEVVGYSQDAYQQLFAMYWKDGFPKVVGPGWANAINQKGVVVGTSWPLQKPWIWKVGEPSPTPLPLPVGENSATAFAINNSGVIAGAIWRSDANRSHSIYYVTGGRAYDLGTPPGYFSALASGINEAGDLIITAYSLEYPYRSAFLWRKGNFYKLSNYNSFVSGINNSGSIVGTVQDNTYGSFNFVYKNGTLTVACEVGFLTSLNNRGDMTCGDKLISNNGLPTGLYDISDASRLSWWQESINLIKINNRGAVIGRGLRNDLPCAGPCQEPARAFVAIPLK